MQRTPMRGDFTRGFLLVVNKMAKREEKEKVTG